MEAPPSRVLLLTPRLCQPRVSYPRCKLQKPPAPSLTPPTTRPLLALPPEHEGGHLQPITQPRGIRPTPPGHSATPETMAFSEGPPLRATPSPGGFLFSVQALLLNTEGSMGLHPRPSSLLQLFSEMATCQSPKLITTEQWGPQKETCRSGHCSEPGASCPRASDSSPWKSQRPVGFSWFGGKSLTVSQLSRPIWGSHHLSPGAAQRLGAKPWSGRQRLLQ